MNAADIFRTGYRAGRKINRKQAVWLGFLDAGLIWYLLIGPLPFLVRLLISVIIRVYLGAAVGWLLRTRR